MKYLLGFAILTLMSACQNTQSDNKRVENLEIYQTTGDEKTMTAGPMTHHESTEYLGNRKVATTYYATDGMVKGKEVFYYENEKDSTPVKADYIDDKQKLLSYYKYIKDGNDRLIASYAFDASTDELLRVEQYYYTKSTMTSKRIFDSQLNPSRRYAFTHDMYGNETGFQVYNQADSLVANEVFKITKMDKHNKWSEKWGFANGKPLTKHVRK
jgi:hypothetical protein